MNTEKTIQDLQYAIRTQDGEKAEDAFESVYEFEIKTDFVPFLIELLDFDWHFMHENIVLMLQRVKDNRATKSLYKTANKKLSYLDYNNSYALARKCTWALADIGTKESKYALRKLSESADETISDYAKKRIDNWDNEMARKK